MFPIASNPLALKLDFIAGFLPADDFMIGLFCPFELSLLGSSLSSAADSLNSLSSFDGASFGNNLSSAADSLNQLSFFDGASCFGPFCRSNRPFWLPSKPNSLSPFDGALCFDPFCSPWSLFWIACTALRNWFFLCLYLRPEKTLGRAFGLLFFAELYPRTMAFSVLGFTLLRLIYGL